MSGPVVGKMHKGEPITRPAVEPDEAGAPHRAAPAGPVPRGIQHEKEEHKTTRRNPRKAH
jgi:hypothetical protein